MRLRALLGLVILALVVTGCGGVRSGFYGGPWWQRAEVVYRHAEGAPYSGFREERLAVEFYLRGRPVSGEGVRFGAVAGGEGQFYEVRLGLGEYGERLCRLSPAGKVVLLGVTALGLAGAVAVVSHHGGSSDSGSKAAPSSSGSSSGSSSSGSTSGSTSGSSGSGSGSTSGGPSGSTDCQDCGSPDIGVGGGGRP